MIIEVMEAFIGEILFEMDLNIGQDFEIWTIGIKEKFLYHKNKIRANGTVFREHVPCYSGS